MQQARGWRPFFLWHDTLHGDIEFSVFFFQSSNLFLKWHFELEGQHPTVQRKHEWVKQQRGHRSTQTNHRHTHLTHLLCVHLMFDYFSYKGRMEFRSKDKPTSLVGTGLIKFTKIAQKLSFLKANYKNIFSHFRFCYMKTFHDAAMYLNEEKGIYIKNTTCKVFLFTS